MDTSASSDPTPAASSTTGAAKDTDALPGSGGTARPLGDDDVAGVSESVDTDAVTRSDDDPTALSTPLPYPDTRSPRTSLPYNGARLPWGGDGLPSIPDLVDAAHTTSDPTPPVDTITRKPKDSLPGSDTTLPLGGDTKPGIGDLRD